MIKNTDKIAEKEATVQLEKDKVKNEAEEKVKAIRAAKNKMTAALNKSLEKKKEEKAAKKVLTPSTNTTTIKESKD